jgi:type 1 glutamine amidotransferase
VPLARPIGSALGLRALRVDPTPPQLPVGFGAGDAVAILIFSKTAGYRHQEAIPAAERAVREIAARRGWQVFATENAAVFDPALLAQVDAVFGNNITGDCWTDAQKAAFRSWVEGGGGFVGVHGAAGTEYEYWPWYQDVLIGARFSGHPMDPQFQTATLHVEDRAHPASAQLPDPWVREDEWYSFASNPRAIGVRVLATLDESTYHPEAGGKDLRMGADHPIIWSHCVGRGRAFFSALGHKGEYYAEPAHARLLEGALAWGAGLEGEACAAGPSAAADERLGRVPGLVVRQLPRRVLAEVRARADQRPGLPAVERQLGAADRVHRHTAGVR